MSGDSPHQGNAWVVDGSSSVIYSMAFDKTQSMFVFQKLMKLFIMPKPNQCVTGDGITKLLHVMSAMVNQIVWEMPEKGVAAHVPSHEHFRMM